MRRARTRYRLRYDDEDIGVSVFPFVIGREPTSQLVLKQDLVSRHHAQLIASDDGPAIEDLGSMNGVFVNQRRIAEPTLVAHGDVIAIGSCSLEFIDALLVPRAAKPTRPLPPHIASDVSGPEPVTVSTRPGVLSEREREVFLLIVLGHTQREIANKLHISVKTIETHRAHIAEKLHCRTRAEMVAYAITAGLMPSRPNESG